MTKVTSESIQEKAADNEGLELDAVASINQAPKGSETVGNGNTIVLKNLNPTITDIDYNNNAVYATNLEIGGNYVILDNQSKVEKTFTAKGISSLVFFGSKINSVLISRK